MTPTTSGHDPARRYALPAVGEGCVNRRVLALDLRDPDASVAKAKVVVPERMDAVLTTFAVARDALYIKSMRAGTRPHRAHGLRQQRALTPVAAIAVLERRQADASRPDRTVRNSLEELEHPRARFIVSIRPATR
ncbi:MAG: hypothetical protein U1F19_05520 [Lysobacterales bacterium]